MNASTYHTADGLIATLGQGPDAIAIERLLDHLATAPWPHWEDVVTRLQVLSPPANLALLEAGHRRWPSRSDIGFLLGNHLRVRGRAADAERVLREAIANQPEYLDAGLSLCYLLREQGRLNEANEVLVASWRNGPRTRNGDMATLQLLCENHGHALAASLLPDMVQRHPSDAALLAKAGEIHLLLGDFDDAANDLRRAVGLDPASAASWLRLAQTHRFSHRDDPDLRLLELARGEPSLPQQARTAIDFAIGKARADLGDIDAAVTALRRANQAERQRVPWNRSDWQAFVLSEAQSPPLRRSNLQLAFTPVFIVGLPRSGTTLAAQQLSSHPELRNRGELNWIASIAAKLGPAPDQATLDQAATLIAKHLRRDDAPARCYLDKNPLNFRHLRLIAALFPNANIVHCRRDRRDTALSIWSQHFAHADLGWAYDFDDIAAFDDGYRRLMAVAARWNLATCELDYERLVADPDETVRAVERFLGLPPRDSATLPSEPAQAIATASVWQARQPVHRDSVQRWKAWAPLLPELIRSFPE